MVLVMGYTLHRVLVLEELYQGRLQLLDIMNMIIMDQNFDLYLVLIKEALPVHLLVLKDVPLLSHLHTGAIPLVSLDLL